MSSKEKAEELYKKMYENCTMTLAGAGSIWPQLVNKQCLLVCDEVINELEQKEQNMGVKFSLIWWNDVKKWVNANS